MLCKHDDDVHVQVKTNDLIDRGFWLECNISIPGFVCNSLSMRTLRKTNNHALSKVLISKQRGRNLTTGKHLQNTKKLLNCAHAA